MKTTSELRPTHARYWVIVFAVALAVLSYIDRVAISQAAGPISHDLRLDKSGMGLIFGAFGLSYALFEVPSGWLGDLIGARKVLVRIVLAWSAFTALTGAAWNFASLWTIRFLFGAGEAGCFPNITKAFSVWLPSSERAPAQGLLWAFARWGGAFTPPLVVFAFHHMSWRAAFGAFGALGLVWCFLFARWFRDRPSEHPSVNPAELALLREVRPLAASRDEVPWRTLVTHPALWLLWTQYFCVSFGWYFYITWLPTYLQEFRHQSAESAARLAILPLLFGGFGALTSGIVSLRRPKARRSIAIAGMLGAAAFICIVPRPDAPLIAMLAMGMASFANDLAVPVAWHSCMDIGGKYAGTVSGSMNMMGNLAGFVAPAFGGYLLDRTHGDWNLLLYVMAAIYVAGALCWPFIDLNTSIDRSTQEVVD
ncbi:MAG TPA: MFS transporter [Bryobacteraceae bacterium]|nr:MFS transporter [Bryobacteraceae bacterium]